jgi:hypothetical protein
MNANLLKTQAVVNHPITLPDLQTSSQSSLNVNTTHARRGYLCAAAVRSVPLKMARGLVELVGLRPMKPEIKWREMA